MKDSICYFCFFITSACTFAQDTKVVGSIRQKDGPPISFATVSLELNKELVYTGVSDTDGNFNIPGLQRDSSYLLNVSYIGFNSFSKAVKGSSDTIPIILEKSPTSLREVGITATRPIIERRSGKVIFNVENSPIASGGTVWDALTKAPGVRANFDGAITANNKGAAVYLDGRPLRLSGEELANYLRSLPSSNVSSIEVIANPSARFDAEGGAIINILSRKTSGKGLNATLSSGFTQGAFPSFNQGVNFNFRKGKANLYGNTSYNNTKKQRNENEYILFSGQNSYADWSSIKRGTRQGNSLGYKMGLDYNISKRSVMGILIDGIDNSNSTDIRVFTDIRNNFASNPDSTLNTSNNLQSDVRRTAFNVNFKSRFDSLGQSINIDVDYSPYKNRREQDVQTRRFLFAGATPDDPYSILNSSSQNIDIFSAKMDYTKPLNKTVNFESGLKYTSISTRNNFEFFNLESSPPFLDTNRSNRFKYDEGTYAAYLDLTKKYSRLNLKGGLRGEYTTTEGFSATLNNRNRNTYFKLFPTLFIDFTPNDQHQLNWFYGYRISRPDFWRLNPFKAYSSPYTFIEGNPALKPAFTHETELGYTYKSNYNVTFYFRETDDFFSNITVQDNQLNLFYDTQQNLDKSLETGLYGSFALQLSKKWESNNYLQGAFNQQKSSYLSSQYNYKTLFYFFSSNNSILISEKKNVRAEINAWYASPTMQGIFRLGTTYDLSLGLQKTILSGNGRITLAFSDVFKGTNYRVDVRYLNQENGFIEKNDTRTLGVSFSYKIGNINLKNSRERKTASQDEQNRTAK